jgi:septum site-determining protein MinC
MKNAVSIKGTREGLTITLGQGEFDDLLAELSEHLKTQGAFFRGGRVALQIGDYGIDEHGLTQLNEMLSHYEMVLRTVVSSNPVSQMAVRALGLRLLEPTPVETPAPPAADAVAPRAGEPAPAGDRGRPAEPSSSARTIAARPASALEGTKGVLIRHLVRSGQVIRHTGHVVIIGDVNVGAEIVAGGDIVIWGRLFGTVHAGAMGDDSAVVCALDFSPLQLRIGNHVARPGEDARPAKRSAEVASVRDNLIVVQPWDMMTLLGV